MRYAIYARYSSDMQFVGKRPTAVSTVTRACAYDRLGQASSDSVPAGVVRTAQDDVNDLIALLEAAEIEQGYRTLCLLPKAIHQGKVGENEG